MTKTKEKSMAKVRKAARVKAGAAIANRRVPDKTQFALANAATCDARLESIAAEACDCSKKSLEDGLAFVEKLILAKSFESVAYIGSEYTEISFVNCVACLAKIGQRYGDFAKDAVSELPYIV